LLQHRSLGRGRDPPPALRDHVVRAAAPELPRPRLPFRDPDPRRRGRRARRGLHARLPHRVAVLLGVPALMGRGLVLRFAAGALVGVMTAVALGSVLRPRIPSTANSGTPVSVTATDGAEIDFQLVDANPMPLEPLPATATIQLAAFHA